MKVENKEKNFKKELYIKIIILIILIMLITITSFNTGRKFFVLKNTYIESTKGEINSNVARWEFKAKIRLIDNMKSE